MKFKNILCLFFITALTLFLLMPSIHAADKEGKIGVFDMQRIIKESKAGQKARATLEKGLTERRKILANKEQELQKFQNELDKSKNLESAEMRQKEKELARELRDLKRLRVDLEEEMKNMDEELAFELLKDIMNIVKTIGQKESYSVIFQKSPSMVYVGEATDITSEVLKRYDAQFKE